MSNPKEYSNISEMLHANNLLGNESSSSNSGGNFIISDGNNGPMKESITSLFGDGIHIATGSLETILPKGAVFEGDLFAWADGVLTGKISYDDFWKMAKKTGLKLDVSLVKETGADLGANMSFISGGQQGQER